MDRKVTTADPTAPAGSGQPSDHDLAVALPSVELIEQLDASPSTVVYRIRGAAPICGGTPADPGGGSAEYALKILKYPVDDDRILAAFRREAARLATTDGASLPRVHEVGRIAGRPYLITDLIPGERLSHLLRQGRLPDAQIIALAIDVAEALAVVHLTGLAHREVTPDAIVVSTDGRAWLIGCCLPAADQTSDPAADQTSSHGTMAAPQRYTAPELPTTLHRPMGGRADLYALGAVLLNCLAGPHRGAGTTLEDVPATPLGQIIGKLLARDPDDRYQSCDGLICDLRRLGQGHDPGAFPLGTDDHPADDLREVPFVGREESLEQLRQRWTEATTGRGGVVLVRGLPGVGKTRLVHELTSEIHACGYPVVHGRITRDEPAPLACLLAAIGDQADAACQDAGRRDAGRRAPRRQGLRGTLPPAARITAGLRAIAAARGGAVLHLDDGQWADASTRAALRHLSQELSSSPLLVIVTVRDDPASEGGVRALEECLLDPADPDVLLAPLTTGETADLIATCLPGIGDIATHLAELTGGNPLVILEGLRLLVETGAIRPSWGRWIVDRDHPACLQPAPEALDLFARRISLLPAADRSVLTAAAVAGTRFEPDLVADLCGISARQVLSTLADAIPDRLVQATGRDEYTFWHNQVLEAIIATACPGTLRHLHQRAAEILDHRAAGDSASGYLVARHYLRGELPERPDRVIHTCTEAGRVALAADAPDDALAFLEPAELLAREHSIVPGQEFGLLLCDARYRAGHVAEAWHALRGLGVPDQIPARRAAVLALTARLHLVTGDASAALDLARDGLRTLGRPSPSSRLGLVVAALLSGLRAALTAVTGIGSSTLDDERRRLLRTMVTLHGVLAHGEALNLALSRSAAAEVRAWSLVQRLGVGAEHVLVHAGLGCLAVLLGLRRTGRWLLEQSRQAAATIADPRHTAAAAGMTAAADFLTGSDDGDQLRACVERHWPWLDVTFRLEAVKALAHTEIMRGATDRAKAWYDRGVALLGPVPDPGLTSVGIALNALRGQHHEVAAGFDALRAHQRAGGIGAALETALLTTQVAVEQGDLGDTFERGVAAFGRVRAGPAWGGGRVGSREWVSGGRAGRLGRRYRSFFVYHAFGRLAQCRSGLGGAPAERRAAARRSVLSLGRAADTPLLRAFHQVATASLAQLSGDHRKALRSLALAQPLIDQVDAPLAGYEAARVRARALRALGRAADADRQARYALALANEHGWSVRARWIEAEFAVSRPVRRRWHRTAVAPGAGDVAGHLHREVPPAGETLDAETVLSVLFDQLTAVLAADRAWLLRSDQPLRPDGTTLSVAAVYPAAGQPADPGPDRLVLPAGLASGLRTGTVMTGDEDDPPPDPLAGRLQPRGCWMMLPLVDRGDLAGLVVVASTHQSFGDGQTEIGLAMINHAMTVWDNARLVAEIQRLTTTDDLTGLANRRQFLALAEAAVSAAAQRHGTLSALIIDLDSFRQINRQYGHQVGDEVIQAAARRITQGIRQADLLGRYGGAEFALIMSEVGEEAIALSQRLRDLFAAEPIPTSAGSLPVTISVGLTSLDSDRDDLTGVLARADRALEQARAAGRERDDAAR